MAWKETEKLFHYIIGESKLRRLGKQYEFPELTANDRLVWLLLAFHKNHNSGQCNPSYETLAMETGLGRTTVAESIRRLKQHRITSDPRSGHSSWYSWELPDGVQETLAEFRAELAAEQASPSLGQSYGEPTSTETVLNQYGSRTNTSTPDVPHPGGSRTSPVREAYPNRGINLGNENRKRNSGKKTGPGRPDPLVDPIRPLDEKTTGGYPLKPPQGRTPAPRMDEETRRELLGITDAWIKEHFPVPAGLPDDDEEL
jgi:Helix-turn-helix domain